MSATDVKKFKIVVVGDSESGKTALLTVFTEGEFPEVWVKFDFNAVF